MSQGLRTLDELVARAVAGGVMVTDATLLHDLPGMDSLRFMTLVSEIEEATGTMLDVEVLATLETVGDLRRLAG